MLFGKKKQKELPPMPGELEEGEPVEQPADYSTVLEFLLGLSEQEYNKMCKVVTVYRAANKEASRALGIKPEPTTYLPQPENVDSAQRDKLQTTPPTVVAGNVDDEDFLEDDLETAFLDDAAPTQVTAPKNIPVKDEDKE